MKDNTIRYLVAFIGIVLAVASIVFGSILPFMKARSFITTSQKLSNIESVEEMKQLLDPMFSFYSPVGDEELVKFTTNSLFSVVANAKQGEQVSRIVLEYLEPKAHKNNVRHLIIVARMYLSLFENYRNPEYLDKAEGYYLLVNEIGPKLPQPLYALFEIYQAKGDTAKASEMGERILTLWPTETRLQRLGN